MGLRPERSRLWGVWASRDPWQTEFGVECHPVPFRGLGLGLIGGLGFRGVGFRASGYLGVGT